MAEEIHGTVGRGFGPETQPSRGMASGKNAVNLNWGDPNLSRKPDYYIYVFTVSKRKFLIRQPTLFPRLEVPACGPNERYKLVIAIPHPLQQQDVTDGGAGQLISRGYHAEDVAMSLCNPNNLTRDQEATPPAGTVLGIGNNLTVQGVFWTPNETPTEKELVAAELRREKYYRSLLNKARALENSNPKALEGELNIDYRMAADYFGEETSWHKKHIHQEACPNCGESIKPGVAFHKNKELEMICVIDPIRAAAAGVKV